MHGDQFRLCPSLIACIVLDDNRTRTRLVPVTPGDFALMDSRMPMAGDCVVVQRGRHVWLTAKCHALQPHWRWRPQSFVNWLRFRTLWLIGYINIFLTPNDGGRIFRPLISLYEVVVGDIRAGL
jgi:hypothetical protein